MSWMDNLKIRKNPAIYYYDIEVYFNDELVYAWRQITFEEIETTLKVTKAMYTTLCFVKNKCEEWNYKVVIK